jgi:regulator of RNase E activity RraA
MSDKAKLTESSTLGSRILSMPERAPQATVDAFRRLPTGNIADSMGRFGAMLGISLMVPGVTLGGPALTVLLRPGDNLVLHKAVELATPGDVIVVTCYGGHSTAVWGEMLSRTAQARGIAGLVVDGAVRDLEALRDLRFPVFARALSAASCDKDGPGEINVPIACGGVVVSPGDLIVGDADGVVVVPIDHAEAVLVSAESKYHAEAIRRKETSRSSRT